MSVRPFSSSNIHLGDAPMRDGGKRDGGVGGVACGVRERAGRCRHAGPVMVVEGVDAHVNGCESEFERE